MEDLGENHFRYKNKVFEKQGDRAMILARMGTRVYVPLPEVEETIEKILKLEAKEASVKPQY